MSAKYCIDSDVLIWHLRSGERQKAVEQHLVRLATSGSLSCSTLSVAEVEQGVRRGEEEKTRALLRSFEAHPVDRTTAERAGEIVCELRSRGLPSRLQLCSERGYLRGADTIDRARPGRRRNPSGLVGPLRLPSARLRLFSIMAKCFVVLPKLRGFEHEQRSLQHLEPAQVLRGDHHFGRSHRANASSTVRRSSASHPLKASGATFGYLREAKSAQAST
jgi:predicted nucleic acid-binding protein